MGVTFISKIGGGAAIGTIVLWFGNKADIPIGWAYYSAAAGYWVKGATSANTTPQNTTDHIHTYSEKTGLAGEHEHAFSASSGALSGGALVVASGAAHNGDIAEDDHIHSTSVSNVSTDPDHQHSMNSTLGQVTKPPSIGLFYIKRTS